MFGRTKKDSPQRGKQRPKRRRWLRILGGILLVLLLLGGALLAESWTAMGKPPGDDRHESFRRSPQFHDGTFRNALPEQMQMGKALWRWVKGGDNREPEAPPPIIARTGAEFATPPPSGLRVTWLGHSTTLIEIDGARILFDPVWGDRSGPSRFVGPKRFHEPPLPLDELPPIDAVVISHDHYDHLDYSTMVKLRDTNVPFVVPLGVGSHLRYWGIDEARITELAWWEEKVAAGIRLVCTPSRHFSGRSLTDRNKTLWASWALVGDEHRVYFSGDTAMFPGFAEIGKRLGPFDIAMIESGAYDQSWADVHLGPEQAVQAFQMVRGKLMLPVHWGTFNLALHGWTEPVERVLAAAREQQVQVYVPRPGESIDPAAPPEQVRWWPDLPWKTADENPIVSSGLDQAALAPPAVTLEPETSP